MNEFKDLRLNEIVPDYHFELKESDVTESITYYDVTTGERKKATLEELNKAIKEEINYYPYLALILRGVTFDKLLESFYKVAGRKHRFHYTAVAPEKYDIFYLKELKDILPVSYFYRSMFRDEHYFLCSDIPTYLSFSYIKKDETVSLFDKLEPVVYLLKHHYPLFVPEYQEKVTRWLDGETVTD